MSSSANDDTGWIQSRDPGFTEFIRNVLREQDEYGAAGSVVLQKQQQVIRTFLRDTPYRGVLVYHGLGSGKTCAAIAAAEAMEARYDRVVVMLPASLANNFREEINKCGNKITPDSVHFVSTNGVSPSKIKHTKSLVDGVSLHNSVIIIDEVHNLAGQIRNGGERGTKLYKAIFNARNAKVVCLSGTIIVNSPFELAIVINMLSGPLRSIVFHKPTARSDDVHKILSSHTKISSFRTEGLKVVADPVPEGYRRKSPKSPLVVVHKSSPPDLSAEPHKAAADEISSAIGAAYHSTRQTTRFPEEEEDFNRIFTDGGRLKNSTAFQTASLGTVSHFSLTQAEAKSKGFPDVLPEMVVRLDMTETMYDRYVEHRLAEIDMEDRAARKKKRTGEDKSGNFKSMSRMICNFAFEKKGDRTFKSMLGSYGEAGARDHDAVNERAIRKLTENGMEALRGDSLRESSPKMASIMQRLEAAPGPSLVYSNYRNMEGIGIFALALEAAGYSRVQIEADGSVSGDPSKPCFFEFLGAAETGEGVRVFNGENASWNKRRPAGAPPVDVIMITQAGAEGISLKGVREVHIMEPHWNEVRIQQVVGRAARLDSHSHLVNEEDRNVTVYRYIMQFGKSGSIDKRINKRDRGKTTDEIIMATAEEKAELSTTFVDALKSVAIDCGLYPDSVECGVNAKARVRSRSKEPEKRTPKYSLIERDGVVYIMDKGSKQLYSYEEYKRTGQKVAVKV